MNDDSSKEPEVCPICLGGEENESTHTSNLVYGNCGHGFCLPCLTQHCAAPVNEDEPQYSVPTMGRCPICRQTLCLLDLKRRSQNTDGYAVARETDMTKTDLAGLVFVKRRRREGEESIHFPFASEDENEGSNKLPYVSFENYTTPFEFDDGTTQWIQRKYFDANSCRYHASSRTFHGIIRLAVETETEQHQSTSLDCGKRIYNCAAWEYILSFSTDFRYVARGVLIERREPCCSHCCKRAACKFPLDGEWTVEWDAKSTKDAGTVFVHGNSFFIGDLSSSHANYLKQRPSGYVDFCSTSIRPILCWIEDDSSQCRQISSKNVAWNHISEIGDIITWPKLSERYDAMLWRRKTKTPLEAPLRVVGLGSDRGLSYHRLGAVSDDSLAIPPYHSDRLWGNVFSQVLTVGMASYHFNDDNTAYISYEHERTSLWPGLDNGEPIPPIMHFTNTSFDEQSKTFRGTIDWEGTHGTTWTSSRWWSYEIVFANDYSFIISGAVRVKRHGMEEETIMSKFGEDLLYINAGFAEKTRREWESGFNTFGRLTGEANTFRNIQSQMEIMNMPSENIDRLKSLYLLARTHEIQYPATRLFSEQNYGM